MSKTNETEMKLPYTRVSEEENEKISTIMNNWKSLVDLANQLGYSFRLYPYSDDLEFYYNDDFPGLILVDK